MHTVIHCGGKMKIELTIDRMKKLSDGAIPALESELLKRLSELNRHG